MAYRYIGSAVTNTRGIGELELTSYGKGKLDIVASTTNPPTAGSIISDVYVLWDCLKYDVNNNLQTSDYTLSGQGDTLTIVDDHKEFTTTQSSGRRCYLQFTNAPSDFRIELEVKFSNMGNVGLWGYNTDTGKYKQNENSSEWVYYRINKTSDAVTIQKSSDGLNWVNVTVSNYGSLDLSATQYRLLLTSVTGTTYFRNIKIYSI